jgi:hypothetical protein
MNDMKKWCQEYNSSDALQAVYPERWLYVACRYGQWCADEELTEVISWLKFSSYGASIAANAPKLYTDLYESRRPAPQASIQGPPESLVNQWWAEWTNDPNKPKSLHQFIAKKTTQWHQENEKNN